MRLHLGFDGPVSGQLAQLLQGVERRLASPPHRSMLAQTDADSSGASSTCAPSEKDCRSTIGAHPHPDVELFVVAAVALIVGFVLGRLFPSKNLVKVNKDQ